LPLPWFIQRFSPAYKIKQSALQVPFFSQLWLGKVLTLGMS
jgi:Ca-activated chloride channel family protein